MQKQYLLLLLFVAFMATSMALGRQDNTQQLNPAYIVPSEYREVAARH